MSGFPQTQVKYFPLTGGLDQITPPLSLGNGMCRDALNFECAFGGGYTRVAGYERYDGRPAPSDAVFYSISCTFSATVSVGNTITGATSAGTGVVIAVGADYIAFTKKTGTLVSGENLQVGGVTKAVSTSVASVGSASSQELAAQYNNLAADVYRTDIAAVPGAGSVLGAWYYNGNVYAFRNNVGNTAAVMHKATTGGWSAVSLGYEVTFSNANTSVGDGDTLTQGAVTATISRVVVESGTLVSGTNTGKLIISVATGGNFAAGAATSTGGGALTLGGAEAAITLPPNGTYEFVNNNFGGGVSTERMYGASGTGRAFEFDGTVFVPIKTGMTTDTPTHIACHNNHLFLSFGSSVQHSGIRAPYMFTVTTGAGEIAMGSPVTAFQVLPGSEASASLGIFCDNKIAVLYGTSAAGWQLTPYSQEIGAKAYTVQNVGLTGFLDVFGIRLLQTSQNFGNFEQGQASQLISPFIEERVGRQVASYVSRKKNHYRLLFNDKYGVTLTVNANQIVGLMPFYYAHTMSCASSHEATDGSEMILCGSTDGYVFRMEKGTSFDGDAIDAAIVLAFNSFGSPRTRKRFRKAVYEVTGSGFSKYQASYELGYGAEEYDQLPITSSFSGTDWDAFTWDSFYWDGKTLLPAEQDITGVAENISLILRTSYDYVPTFTINSVMMHFTPRRLMR